MDPTGPPMALEEADADADAAAAAAADAVELLPRLFAAAAAAAVAGCVGASSWLSPLLPLPELSDFIGQICSKYFKTPIGFWKSSPVEADVRFDPSSECSIRTGPKQMARF